jgi:hypothetical protein
MRARSLSSLFAAVALFAAAGCGGTDNPTSPSAAAARPVPTETAHHSLLFSSPVNVKPLQRTTPLAAPITVSKYIGILGGTIAIPQAGLSVVVPPLAVTSTKLFKITALAGSNVAYTFEPHGTNFTLPLVATQSLKNTQAQAGGLIDPLSLSVGYFTDDNNVNLVSELLTVGVNLLNQTSVVTLWHFSGYMWSTGRCDDSSDF